MGGDIPDGTGWYMNDQYKKQYNLSSLRTVRAQYIESTIKRTFSLDKENLQKLTLNNRSYAGVRQLRSVQRGQLCLSPKIALTVRHSLGETQRRGHSQEPFVQSARLGEGGVWGCADPSGGGRGGAAVGALGKRAVCKVG